MIDALMGKKIRGASACECKSASMYECFREQNITPID